MLGTMLSNLQAISYLTLDKMRCFLVGGGGEEMLPLGLFSAIKLYIYI